MNKEILNIKNKKNNIINSQIQDFKNISGNNTSYGNGTSDYSFLEKYFSIEDIYYL